jgi:TonB family protein
MPELPQLASTTPNAISMALPVATVQSPRLPVPVRIVRTLPKETAVGSPAVVVAESPAIPTPAMDAGAAPAWMPSLVAISVAPAPPSDEFVPPGGNRFGEFAASPKGSGEESAGVPLLGEGGSSGDERGGFGDENAQIRLPGISIRGGSSAGSSEGGTGGDSDLRKLMAGLSRPTLTPGNIAGSAATAGIPAGRPAIESEFFGTRRVYTVYMNMPNLTSASGSWVLRFAELSGPGNAQDAAGDLTTPEAVRKVDPMYVASAMRERVQGTVTLAAMVLKDGTLANIRVVGSLDPRLDSSAVAALTQWRFRPASKNGTPVDLEVLIQSPFRTGSL